jgi:prophage antirepressor-like protein
MNNMQVFNFSGTEVRTIMFGTEPWWVAKDVCDVLGLSNTTEAVRTLDDDEKSTLRITEGGPERNVISESGLYSLIMRSNKPEAKTFKRWVTHEILPTIRKHGAYVTPVTMDNWLNDPDMMIKALEALKVERQLKAALEVQAKQLTAQLQYKDEVITGLVEDVDAYTKRTVINRVVKRGGSPAERYRELYRVFRETNHVDLVGRAEGYNKKQLKKKDHLNGIGYAEKFGHMNALYDTVVKLYETDVEQILNDIRNKR